MDFDQSMILDATRGSIARFVNHSCAPNCRMIKWTVAGKPRVALFAGDNGIMTGEELTYDYNFDPYSVKNVQECRCRAEGCRGVLGPKPKEMREAPKPMTRGGKRIFRQVIEDAVGTVTKKRKIAVASSVKSADTTTRAETSKRLMRARALGSSTAQRESLVKKVSKCSLKGVARKTTRETVGNGKERRGCTVKYSRRRSSVASSAGVDSESEILNRRSPAKGRQAEKAERPKSRRESVKTGVKENVVRTMRGSNRGTPGKTMWVMGDDEFKGWRDS